MEIKVWLQERDCWCIGVCRYELSILSNLGRPKIGGNLLERIDCGFQKE
jgi:hypothetical protein